MTSLDRDLLEAFLPEFEAEAARLAAANDAAGAVRAVDQLRAMAAALGAPSLVALAERAGAALDPMDIAALREVAEKLAQRAGEVAAAGVDAPASAAAAPPSQPSPRREEGVGTLLLPSREETGGGRQPALDPELLAAFMPEFTAGCARLATARDAAAAMRAVAALDSLAATLALDSLRGLLRGAPLDPFDAPALPPLAAALARHANAIAAAGHDLPAPAPTRRRVLVVDDSPTMRRLVHDILITDLAFEVVAEAADGRAALMALADLQPDLTMLDIEMPEMDGIGVLRAWALRGPGAVVVVSSAARPGSATAIEARSLGAAGIVSKPSGALSPDLRQRGGEALLRTARRAAGLPA